MSKILGQTTSCKAYQNEMIHSSVCLFEGNPQRLSTTTYRPIDASMKAA